MYTDPTKEYDPSYEILCPRCSEPLLNFYRDEQHFTWVRKPEVVEDVQTFPIYDENGDVTGVEEGTTYQRVIEGEMKCDHCGETFSEQSLD